MWDSSNEKSSRMCLQISCLKFTFCITFDFNSSVEDNLTPVGLFPQTSLLSP